MDFSRIFGERLRTRGSGNVFHNNSPRFTIRHISVREGGREPILEIILG
jgi:hypothetical protein